MRAINAAGISNYSPASLSILTALPPEVPLNLDLISRSASQITFNWESPYDNGGISLSGYKVYMAVGSGTFSEIVVAPSATNPTILSY